MCCILHVDMVWEQMGPICFCFCFCFWVVFVGGLLNLWIISLIMTDHGWPFFFGDGRMHLQRMLTLRAGVVPGSGVLIY